MKETNRSATIQVSNVHSTSDTVTVLSLGGLDTAASLSGSNDEWTQDNHSTACSTTTNAVKIIVPVERQVIANNDDLTDSKGDVKDEGKQQSSAGEVKGKNLPDNCHYG
ncbi:hypothetical protein JYU34_004109 [Plutella xylostella]|uniref:Uncharacterized protein n=1 Tax=Plutella xylostella TaxID=51655 RepID=A0ABQ7QX57_PLUXY|nr:hypothetical protein JYU34_004109 [Plutella xylostella]